MKGASAGIEFVGKVIISLFIVVVIIMLMIQFLPDIFSEGACVSKQVENTNDIANDAIETRSTTIKSFTVENCVESVNFTAVRCTISGSEHRCYETLGIGQVDGNCESVTDNLDCSKIRGTLSSLPGGFNNIDINSEDGDLKYTPGKYLVRIGPHSIKFLERTSSSEENG